MSSLSDGLDVFSKALNLRTQRHQILASNVANADTPNYKAKDFDFAQAMQSALSGRGQVLAMAQSASGHLPGSAAAGLGQAQFRREVQSAVDGNTVDMDVERAKMAENAMQYEVLTKLVTDRLQGMRAAIASNQG